MMAKRNKTLLSAFALLFLAVLVFISYWHLATPQQTCGSCHEIQSSLDVWAQSAHRDVTCSECHGTAFSSGWHSLKENGKRLVGHFSTQRPENIMLNEAQVLLIIERCRGCHQNEYADWLSGGHSVTYEAIFLNEKHNKTEQLHADCLRCHGMFYDESIATLVTPLNIEGPWQLLKPDKARHPTIPCLACHTIHLPGITAIRPEYDDPRSIAAKRPLRIPPAGFYDQREKLFFAAELLPLPKISYKDSSVTVSTDNRQRICLQCHAPNAHHTSGSSDDRTPRGVHEGLSCGACHELHSNEARRSCSNCHPATSNCGLDVETMNTTFLSPESPNNIHFVACSDCHIDRIPGR